MVTAAKRGVVLDQPVAPPSAATILLAETEGKMVQGTEEIQLESGSAPEGYQGGTITHRRPVTVWMWKPTQYGWRPRMIKSTNIKHAIEGGWLAYCGDCRQQTCGTPGGTDVNKCPGREALRFRRCPICNKRVMDAPILTVVGDGEDDEAEIVDETMQATTPEQRTKARLDLHISTFHPQEAAIYGIAAKLDSHPTVEPGLKAG